MEYNGYFKPFKPCKGCEYWVHLDGWQGRCKRHGYVCGADSTCEEWLARHGEWTPVSLAMPKPQQLVTVIESKIDCNVCFSRERVMYYSENRGFLDPYGPDEDELDWPGNKDNNDGFKVVFWMSSPTIPDFYYIKKELERL